MVRQWMGILGLAATLLCGCEQQTAEPQPYASRPEPRDSAPPRADTYAAYDDAWAQPAADDDWSLPPSATSGSAAGTSTAPGRATDEPLTPARSAAGRTHVVAKGDTLSALARRYYGDQSRWKDIYNANRSTLRSPDALNVGARLVIP
jgi:nucleoid-associated protein YgaU